MRANVVVFQVKDPVARKMRLRRRHREAESGCDDSAKVLKGMKDVAKSKELESESKKKEEESLKPKRCVKKIVCTQCRHCKSVKISVKSIHD